MSKIRKEIGTMTLNMSKKDNEMLLNLLKKQKEAKSSSFIVPPTAQSEL